MNADRERVVDKMPENFQLLGWIATLFPNAAVIHCVRDVRDVGLSCWVTNFAAITWANDLHHIAQRLRWYRRLMDQNGGITFATTSSAFGFSEGSMTAGQAVTTLNGGTVMSTLKDAFDGALAFGIPDASGNPTNVTYADTDGIVDLTSPRPARPPRSRTSTRAWAAFSWDKLGFAPKG